MTYGSNYIPPEVMRDHEFVGDGPYCEAWSSTTVSGNPVTTGMVAFRSGCGWSRETHPAPRQPEGTTSDE